MSVQLVPPISQLLYSNGRYSSSKSATSVFGTTRDFLFVDFIGLCGKSKRRIRASSGGPSISRFHSKNLSAIKAVIDLERIGNASTQSSDSKRKVANLEDILSERGACGVGFIANLENKASHGIITDALTALGCMEHRGGCGADNDSGDGSGVMTSIPWGLFNDWAETQGIASFDKLHTGVGMVFLPKDNDQSQAAKTGILRAMIWRRNSALSLLIYHLYGMT